MAVVDMSKFKLLLTKIEKMGFDEMYQAGTTSKYHEMNVILKDKERDLQIWVTKSFGNFTVIYRNSISSSKFEQYRFPCKTQKQIIETIINIRENLCAYVQKQAI